MVQRRRSSVTHSRPSSYNIVPKDTALRVISNHLEYLLDKKQLIEDKMVEFKGKGTNLDTDEREVLRWRPTVEDQIDVLKEVVDEISSAENQSSLRALGQRLQDLHQKRALISEAEEYLSLGMSLASMPQYVVIRYKPEVVHQIDVLEKIFKEISWAQLIPLTSGHRGRQVVEYQLPPLLMRVRDFRGFAEIINSDHGECPPESPGECLGSPGKPPADCPLESPGECPGSPGEPTAECTPESPGECPVSPGAPPRESPPESPGSPGEHPAESPPESPKECPGSPGEPPAECPPESPGECPGSPGEPPAECPPESPGECPVSPGAPPGESPPESPGECPGSPGEPPAECPPESPGECPGSPGEPPAECPPESPGECSVSPGAPPGESPPESPGECPGSPGERPAECPPKSPGESPGESFRRCEVVRNMRFTLSMNEIGTRGEAMEQVINKQRHTLFMTSGFEIFCLDLRECKEDQTFSNAHDVPFIPRIASLDLLEENLPTSAGLFKWKSNAYMIGGALKEKPKGTLSCLAYSLSLTDDDGTLSRSESNHIWKLKKPKLWPIVEEINGQIHVIDSAPARRDDNHCCRGCGSLQFSHEVFNSDTASWVEEIVPKLSEGARYCIGNHSVLGDRIYAVADRAFLVFDSNCKEWEAHSKRREGLKNKHSPKDVWHILEHGPGKCIGRFSLPGDDPIYVLIALERNYRYNTLGTHAVAHLVTSTGQILCSQRLLYFFKGPVWPSYMFDGTIIQFDDKEEEGKSSAFCSVVNGDAWDGTVGVGCNYLFINTFDVEMLTDAPAMISIRQLVAKGSEAWPGTIDQDFVRVHAKDGYVYKTDAELGWTSHSTYWSGVRACFL